MATTKIPNSPTKGRKMATELVCACGRRREVSVPANGWYVGLKDVAHVNHWKLDEFEGDIRWGKTIDAFCPKCWGVQPAQRHD